MTDMRSELRKELYESEGKVKHAYQDHLGYWTIGVGRMIDKRKGGGLSDEEIDYLLNNDIAKYQQQVLRRFPWAKRLSPARLGVLICMAFQMGIDGLAGFKVTLSMIERGDYVAAANGMMNSKWARQTPARAKRMSVQMRTGEWQT